MKGFTHFVSGLTLVSFFPAALSAAADGNPGYFILGGAAALLPDTLDFKFKRFFCRHDLEVTPDARHPDPGPIAHSLAHAIDTAAATGKPVTVKLNTVPRGPQAWQQYQVRFNPVQRTVCATIGPLVSMSQTTLQTTAADGASASATTHAEPYPAYLAGITVDILDGPVLSMEPQPDGRVRVDFIPWHRQESHSLVLSLLLGLSGLLIWNATAGAVIFAGHAGHILADQFGFMGSNLLYPFTRQRTHGFQRLHSMDPFANAAMVWTGLLLIFWNLSRAAGPEYAYALPRLLFFGAGLPMLVLRWLPRILTQRSAKANKTNNRRNPAPAG